MLETKYRYIAGIRMYNIIMEVLRYTKSTRENRNDENPYFNWEYDYHMPDCIVNLSLTMDVVMQADNIQIDFIDDHDIAMRNPSTKFLYAYEYIFSILFDILDKRDGLKPLIMCSINAERVICSDRYSPNINKYRDIIDISIPDAEYFNPEEWPYMVHELAHYLKSTTDKNVIRNKVFLNMIKDYILITLMNKDEDNQAESTVSKLESMKFIINLIDSYEIPNLEEEPKDFIRECIKSMYMWNERIKKLIESHAFFKKYSWIHENLTSTISGYPSVLHMTPQSERGEKIYPSFDLFGIYEIFKDIIREARADIIMCEICEMNIEKYLKIMKKPLVYEKKLELTAPYAIYGLRFFAVLLAICENDYDLLNVKILSLNSEFREYITPFISQVSHYREFLRELCDYLCIVKKAVRKGIDEDCEIKRLMKIFSNYSNSSEKENYFHTTLSQLMNAWYRSLYKKINS